MHDPLSALRGTLPQRGSARLAQIFIKLSHLSEISELPDLRRYLDRSDALTARSRRLGGGVAALLCTTFSITKISYCNDGSMCAARSHATVSSAMDCREACW